MKSLNVQAIFNSIDGEANGFYGAGELCSFIRLKQCNLKCNHCDTAYSQNAEPRNYMPLDQIVNSNLLNKVTITGGEPLLQPETADLISLLLELGHRVSVETNGSKLLPVIHSKSNPLIFSRRMYNSLRYIVDYKLPSSGMENFMKEEVFVSLANMDVIKFVIADQVDYDIAKNLVQSKKEWHTRKVFSPAFTDNTKIFTGWPRELAEKMLEDSGVLQDVQYSLQLHKVLWPEAVGSEMER